MTTTTVIAPARPALGRATLWLVLICVVIADALDLMDSTLTTIAAPSIARDLGGGQFLIQWLGSAYALALGVLLVLGGRLGDKFGHRRTFLVGIAGFTLASAVCGFAPAPAIVIMGRLLQGGFGALLIPQGMAIITATFPRDMMGKAFSFFGPMLGVASVGGPLLGAFIIDADIAGLGWRPMFLINIILGSAGFALAYKVLPEVDREHDLVLDGLGAGLLAGAMSAVIYGLILASSDGWGAGPIVLLVASVTLFAGFAHRQATSPSPLIKPSLLRNRGFTAGLVMGLAFFSVVTGLSFVASLFLQQAAQLTPAQTALRAVAPMAVGIIIASFVCMPLMARLGRRLVLAGLLVTLAGAVTLWLTVASVGTAIGPWTMVAPMLLTGLGMGACFGTLFDIALGDIDPSEAGSASGSLSAVQQLAGSIGSAVVTTVWFHAQSGGAPHALQSCLAIVVAICIVCCALTRLLPRHPLAEPHP